MSEKHLYTRKCISECTCWEIRDIQALCWCPGVIVFALYFSLYIFYEQPQRIRPIWNILQCDFCMLAKMSGMDVN